MEERVLMLVCSVQSNTQQNTPAPELTAAYLNPEVRSSFLKSHFSKETWNPRPEHGRCLLDCHCCKVTQRKKVIVLSPTSDLA